MNRRTLEELELEPVGTLVRVFMRGDQMEAKTWVRTRQGVGYNVKAKNPRTTTFFKELERKMDYYVRQDEYDEAMNTTTITPTPVAPARHITETLNLGQGVVLLMCNDGTQFIRDCDPNADVCGQLTRLPDIPQSGNE